MNYIEQIQKAIQPLPQAFVNVGFEFLKATDDSDRDGSYFRVFYFVNKKSNVTLMLSVSATNGSVTVSLNKDKNQRIGLRDYLVAKKRKYEYDTTYFSASVTEYLKLLENLIETEWKDYITGKRWEDIPFDWMGYK